MPLLTDNDYDRVMVFIDLRNVSEGSRMGPGFAIDYYRMVLDLVGRRKLMAAYIFDSTTDVDGMSNVAKFHDRLRFLGFRVVTKELKVEESTDENGNAVYNAVQKEVDVAMACEMVAHALKDNYDVAIVVSGDRDFVPAVQHVQAAGKRVIVASYRNSFSKEMKKYCDTYVELDALPIIEMKPFRKEMVDEDSIPEGDE